MDERTYYPLFPEQTMMVYLPSYVPRWAPNLPVQIRLREGIDVQLLLDAIRKTEALLSFSRVRLHKNDDGTVVQYLYSGESDPVPVADFSRKSEGALNKHLSALARASFPNDCMDVQLYCFSVIRVGQGRLILYFNAHHAIMDAYTVIYMLTYLSKVFTALKNGTPLPPPAESTERLIAEHLAFFRSERYQKGKQWWQAQFATEPHFTSVNGRDSAEFVKEKRYGKNLSVLQRASAELPLRIPLELVNAVSDAAESQNLSPHIYYLLALRSYLGFVSGTEDVTVLATAACRATLTQKAGGLSLAHLLSLRSQIPFDISFTQALREMSLCLNNNLRHADCAFIPTVRQALEPFHTPKDATYHSVIFTFQPYLDVSDNSLFLSVEHIDLGTCSSPLYINIMPRDGSGDLWADYVYSVGYTKRTSVERFHAFLLRFLQNALARPDDSLEALIQSSLS